MQYRQFLGDGSTTDPTTGITTTTTTDPTTGIITTTTTDAIGNVTTTTTDPTTGITTPVVNPYADRDAAANMGSAGVSPATIVSTIQNIQATTPGLYSASSAAHPAGSQPSRKSMVKAKSNTSSLLLVAGVALFAILLANKK